MDDVRAGCGGGWMDVSLFTFPTYLSARSGRTARSVLSMKPIGR